MLSTLQSGEKKEKKSDPQRVLGTDPACRFRRCQIISAVAGRGHKARDANESEVGRCCGSDGAERGRQRGMLNSREGQSLGRGEADRRSRGVWNAVFRQLITENVAPDFRQENNITPQFPSVWRLCGWTQDWGSMLSVVAASPGWRCCRFFSPLF